MKINTLLLQVGNCAHPSSVLPISHTFGFNTQEEALDDFTQILKDYWEKNFKEEEPCIICGQSATDKAELEEIFQILLTQSPITISFQEILVQKDWSLCALDVPSGEIVLVENYNEYLKTLYKRKRIQPVLTNLGTLKTKFSSD